MKCTLIRQLPNHCVPACLESLAKDRGIDICQQDIVAKYPSIFPGGVLNDLNQSPNLETVVRELGLGDNIFQQGFQNLQQFVDLDLDHEILLMWTKEAKHCVRFCAYDPGSGLITVMDPERNRLQKYDLTYLSKISPLLVYFKKKQK